jgi:hypothetical protein
MWYRYTVPKAMDDFIVNNEKKKYSSYGMKSFILWDECFLHFIINNEIIHSFWDSVLHMTYICNYITCFKASVRYCIKGIVSRDFKVCFWCHSIDLRLFILMECVRWLLKFRFCLKLFDFRVPAWLVYSVS